MGWRPAHWLATTHAEHAQQPRRQAAGVSTWAHALNCRLVWLAVWGTRHMVGSPIPSHPCKVGAPAPAPAGAGRPPPPWSASPVCAHLHLQGGPHHLAVLDQVGHHAGHGVDRQRKPHARRGACGHPRARTQADACALQAVLVATIKPASQGSRSSATATALPRPRRQTSCARANSSTACYTFCMHACVHECVFLQQTVRDAAAALPAPQCKHPWLAAWLAGSPVGVKMAVLMPMTRPELSSRGPPLLPGLMAASVWMPPGMVVPWGRGKRRAARSAMGGIRMQRLHHG